MPPTRILRKLASADLMPLARWLAFPVIRNGCAFRQCRPW